MKAYLNNNSSYYEYFKPLFKIQMGTNYLSHFFNVIDSLIYETDLDYDETSVIISNLNTYVENSSLSQETIDYYLTFTSVMMHSLDKYFEIALNSNHPFHKYTLSKASPGSWIVSDAAGAVSGALEGGTAGAAGGPAGVVIVGVLGAVVEGALVSAVETSFSDLIDSWWNS